MLPIPDPPLANLEKAVTDQLREGRKTLDKVLGNPKAPAEERAAAYGDLGNLYFAYELTDAAEACYHNARTLEPASFQWNYASALLSQTLGEFSEAIQLYRSAQRGQTDVRLVYLILIRIGECYRKLSQPDKAKSAFDAAYQLNPWEPAVLARLGEMALAEKRYDDAVKHLEAALKARPDANMLHYPLGMAYRGAGNMDKAREHISKRGMVNVQPPDPLRTNLDSLLGGYRVHLLAGKLAFSAKRYTEAAESFRKAIEADPKEPGAHINLGTTLAQLRQGKEAIAQFETALKLAPDNVTAHFNLGALHGLMGNHVKAIPHLKAVVETKSDDAGAHLLLAHALRMSRKYEDALNYYQRAVELDPALTEGWLAVSSLLSVLGRRDEALNVLEDAHSKMPLDANITHALARLLVISPDLEKRRGQEGLELAQKAFNEVKHYEYARTVAMAYAELNQCDKAVEWMDRAIELASKPPQPEQIIELLKENRTFFKTQRPCRVPKGSK